MMRNHVKKSGVNIIKNIITNSIDHIEIFVEVLKMDQREEVVGMITLDYNNRLNGIVELMHGKKAFEKIGTDDLFNKAFMLGAFSIILAYNLPVDFNEVESKYFKFNEFLNFFGITTLPISSILLKLPVAFITITPILSTY